MTGLKNQIKAFQSSFILAITTLDGKNDLRLFQPAGRLLRFSLKQASPVQSLFGRIPVSSLFLVLLFLVSCRSSGELTDEEELREAEISVNELLDTVPNYRETLQTISGKGRAFVSEPGNSERATLEFMSDRNESLINVRTSVGIEGGQIYVNTDSLLVYNRVDKFAEKVPLNQGKLTSVGSIASVNMLDLFNFTFMESDVYEIYDTGDQFIAVLKNDARIRVSKENGYILEVNQAADNRQVPYSRIIYEGYAEIEGFYLPRKITIFSQDGKSRATLLVQNLEINDKLPELGIELPDDIPIYR